MDTQEPHRSQWLKGKSRWNYSNFVKKALTFGLLGLLTLPTIIYAEPVVTLPKIPDSHLEQHRVNMRPLTTGDKLDKL